MADKYRGSNPRQHYRASYENSLKVQSGLHEAELQTRVRHLRTRAEARHRLYRSVSTTWNFFLNLCPEKRTDFSGFSVYRDFGPIWSDVTEKIRWRMRSRTDPETSVDAGGEKRQPSMPTYLIFWLTDFSNDKSDQPPFWKRALHFEATLALGGVTGPGWQLVAYCTS